MKFSFRSRVNSFRYAFNGIASMIKNEHNSWIHISASIAVVFLGGIFRINPVEWILIVIVAGLVFSTELLNSAIEKLADLVDPNENSRIKLIKDYGAASVLIAAITAIITGALIFIPYIIRLIR